ncbi:MAG: DUF4230 domain-containing protein [Clostridiales bacterium]|nr:DUF4230 domain-containing protein [Clostridiales bacterium]
MKRLISLVLVTSLALALVCSCNKKDAAEETTSSETTATSATTTTTAETTPTTTKPKIVPNVYQIQSICELATLDVYYHNTAKAIKTAGTGVTHWGEEDTPFWFEYTADVSLGIEANQVKFLMEDHDITIFMPHARILRVNVHPESTSDPVFRPHKWYRNDVEITAQDVTDAMKEANTQIREQVTDKTTLLDAAEKRSKQLIENYITQIMDLSDYSYTLHWEYIESDN